MRRRLSEAHTVPLLSARRTINNHSNTSELTLALSQHAFFAIERSRDPYLSPADIYVRRECVLQGRHKLTGGHDISNTERGYIVKANWREIGFQCHRNIQCLIVGSLFPYQHNTNNRFLRHFQPLPSYFFLLFCLYIDGRTPPPIPTHPCRMSSRALYGDPIDSIL